MERLESFILTVCTNTLLSNSLPFHCFHKPYILPCLRYSAWASSPGTRWLSPPEVWPVCPGRIAPSPGESPGPQPITQPRLWINRLRETITQNGDKSCPQNPHTTHNISQQYPHPKLYQATD